MPAYTQVRIRGCAKEFFDTEKICALLDDHYAGKANNGRKIWTVFTFLVWYERFFITENGKD